VLAGSHWQAYQAQRFGLTHQFAEGTQTVPVPRSGTGDTILNCPVGECGQILETLKGHAAKLPQITDPDPSRPNVVEIFQ